MVSESPEAVLYPDEYVYHIPGTYWRVVCGGVRYRSPNSTRGWFKYEALEVAKKLSPIVRVDRRTLRERRSVRGRKKRTTRSKRSEESE